jgi:hypothetical protein
MSSIVLDIIDNAKYDSIKVSPKMDTPIFENKYEDEENGPSQEAASLRLTKILQ